MKTSKFRLWVRTGTVPTWGTLNVIKVVEFTALGYDIVVEGDRGDLIALAKKKPNVFICYERAHSDMPRFSFPD